MSAEPSVREESDRLLGILVDVNSLKDVEDLFRDHLESLITSIRDDCVSWSVYSAESQIFGACWSRAGVAIARNIDLVLPVLEGTMTEDADPELKLRHFILLSEYFSNNRDLQRHVDEPYKFVSTVIEKLVAPGLIWTAGRAAEAIRTAAVCCLCTILQNEIIQRKDKEIESTNTPESDKSYISIAVQQFLPIFDRKVLSILLTLVDDRAKKTRLYSIRVICSIVIIGRQLSRLTDQHIHRIYPVMLKRLDDGCDDVRYAAVEALVEVWSAASEDYDVVVSKSHIDALYTTMIVHLDDPESHFQLVMLGNARRLSLRLFLFFKATQPSVISKSTLSVTYRDIINNTVVFFFSDALKQVARIFPQLLYQKLRNCRSNFRNKAGIDALLEHCQNISSKD